MPQNKKQRNTSSIYVLQVRVLITRPYKRTNSKRLLLSNGRGNSDNLDETTQIGSFDLGGWLLLGIRRAANENASPK